MAYTKTESLGDSLAYSMGRGNEYATNPDNRPDPLTAMIYTIGRGIGLPNSAIRNGGLPGADEQQVLQDQKSRPPLGPGGLTIGWFGHNTLRDIDTRGAPYAATVAEVKAGHDTFMTYARSSGGAALILGCTTGETFENTTQAYAAVQEVNAYLSGKYGPAFYFSSWQYLAGPIGSGASLTCQVMIDAGLTPNAEDRGNIESGIPPQSIRATAGVGHLNQIGYDTYGNRLVRFLNSGVGPPVAGFTGSLASSPASPAPGVLTTFTATVTPAPALYKFRYSDGTIRDYAAGNTASKNMLDGPLTVNLDVQNSSGVNTLNVAALTVQSTPPPASSDSAFLPFFANA